MKTLFKFGLLTFLFVTGFLAFATGPVSGQDAERYKREEEKYQECMTLARQDPDLALDMSMTWRETGGGIPARHCLAVSLFQQKKYGRSAEEFEIIAEEMRRGLGWNFGDQPHPSELNLLPDIYAQGGNAWLLAGEPVKAHTLFSLGIAETSPGDRKYVELLIDRARAAYDARDFEKALADLDLVLEIVSNRPDIYALQTSTYRALGDFDSAWIALEKGLELDPDNPKLMLERGNLNFMQGRLESARADWVQFLRLYPDSPGADAVRENLANLDVKKDPVEDLDQE